MAKQTIGIGTVANDGTGDPLRTAFDKCNDNFDEVYGYKPHPGYVASKWYFPPNIGAINAGTVMNQDSMAFFPFIPSQTITISDLGARVTTGVAANNLQFAIYASDATTKRPTGNALASTGNASAASAANTSAALDANEQLTAGTLYWFATNASINTIVCQCVQAANASLVGAQIGAATQDLLSSAASAGITYLSSPQAFGSWPDVTAATFTEQVNSKCPAVQFKVASIP